MPQISLWEKPSYEREDLLSMMDILVFFFEEHQGILVVGQIFPTVVTQ